MKRLLFILSALIYSVLAIAQAKPCAELRMVQGEPNLYVDGSVFILYSTGDQGKIQA